MRLLADRANRWVMVAVPMSAVILLGAASSTSSATVTSPSATAAGSGSAGGLGSGGGGSNARPGPASGGATGRGGTRCRTGLRGDNRYGRHRVLDELHIVDTSGSEGHRRRGVHHDIPERHEPDLGE